MKKLFDIAAIAILAVTAATSCTKEPAEEFAGNYSFKCSATLGVMRDAQMIDDTVVAEADAVTVYTLTESGQMDIVPAGEDSDEVVICMNITGGNMVILKANCKDGKLVIPEQNRRVTLKTGVTDLDTTECTLKVDGTATRLQNMVVFDIRYRGNYTDGGRTCRVYSSEISFRAKLNEN